MSTRPDILYAQPIDISACKERFLYNLHTGAPDPCDECVLSTRDIMEIYVSRLQQLDKIAKEHTWIGAVWVDAHLMLRYVLIKFGVGDWSWRSTILGKILRAAPKS
jgi:hypothetical protein